MAPEVRLERLRAEEIEARMTEAPIAWLPLGALEFHADHLPNGTDGIVGHRLLCRAAQLAGGVVLPWSYATMGTLALPWSFRFSASLVADLLRDTLRQLAANGVRLGVVLTGHGPLDLGHLVKRVCAELARETPGMRAMGLCYLELNAALGTGLGTAWPVAIDHGSTMETSWIAALEPELVRVDRLPADPDASIVGVYGPNPRFTVDADLGCAQIEAAAALLAERATAALRGDPVDPFADLRLFVERYWPERLVLAGRAGSPGTPAGGPAILLTNPAPVSRYVSGARVTLDGTELPGEGLVFVNPAVAETGEPMPAASLGREQGFYIRRLQTAELRLPVAVPAGRHEVGLRLGLAGVTEAAYSETVEFA
jgi:creatinine amidohydrolase